MPTQYERVLKNIKENPETWLVTGAAGFIGSNIVETLLKYGQKVRGLDNFSFGHKKNIELIKKAVSESEWANFEFIEADIRSIDSCYKACSGIKNIIHQAALGSVPISMEDPVYANSCNIDGFVNMISAAKDNGAKAFVYASSSAVYGDDPTLPKQESLIGKALSPYAVTKHVNELYADVFFKCYGFRSIGLRYFNIYGQRQDPEGAYAAVIPKWFSGLLRNENIFINGDGTITRDFCHINDCVQANILATKAKSPNAWGKVYNVGCGQKNNLTDLFYAVREAVTPYNFQAASCEPQYREFRVGDIEHSLADISNIQAGLGFEPTYPLLKGLKAVAPWYAKHL